MDIQLKRGLLEICVLKALEKQDSYGYQIIKDMKPYIFLRIVSVMNCHHMRCVFGVKSKSFLSA